MTDTQTDLEEQRTSKWGDTEKLAWLNKQEVKRSYLDDVVSRLNLMKRKLKKSELEIINYGALSYAPEKYPQYLVKTKDWDDSKKTILVTGGVHGYETSGVMGAIVFLETKAINYSQHFNFIVVPCVSPWGYETINRWNPKAVDPNRSFVENSPAEESASLMKAIETLNCEIFAHIDLHETTDTDNTVFRPALAARDGIKQDNWNIPDGFYLVGDINNPVDEFQAAMINYPTKSLGLCIGFSNSQYCTTTEVYPDSENVTDEDCIQAQVAAITGGLDYLIKL